MAEIEFYSIDINISPDYKGYSKVRLSNPLLLLNDIGISKPESILFCRCWAPLVGIYPEFWSRSALLNIDKNIII